MGSVSDYIKCPKCMYEHANIEVYYKVGDEYIFCERCGYVEERTHKGIKKNGGVGSWRIMFGGGSLGSFDDKFTRKEFEKEFKKGFENKLGEKPTEVSYTFKSKGKWFIKDLLKNKTYPFQDRYVNTQAVI